MKNFLILLVIFLLVCVDAKATAANEENFTYATLWVDEWDKQAEVLAVKKDVHCSEVVQNLLNSFILKAYWTLNHYALSKDDLLHIQGEVYFAGNIAKRNKCGFVAKSAVAGLKEKIVNQLDKK